jgi:Rrf2 family nitric oxide-sensitive transcriptional repressor
MRLSTFSDYSLRVLMYLACQDDRLATIVEISQAHGVSKNHLMKVVHQLGRNGYVETVRGKGGGIRLARAAQEIVIGDVVRASEADFALAECFVHTGQCRIVPSCRLQGVLGEALAALLAVLDRYTLADLVDGDRARAYNALLLHAPGENSAGDLRLSESPVKM